LVWVPFSWTDDADNLTARNMALPGPWDVLCELGSDRQARSSNPIKCGITKNETPPRHRLSQKVYNKEETHFIWFHRGFFLEKSSEPAFKSSIATAWSAWKLTAEFLKNIRPFIPEKTLSSSQKKNQGWKYGGKGGQAISYTSSEGVVHICTKRTTFLPGEIFGACLQVLHSYGVVGLEIDG
jgi:hypothetical protein